MKDGEEDEKGCRGKSGPKGSLGLAPMMVWFLFDWKCFTIPFIRIKLAVMLKGVI